MLSRTAQIERLADEDFDVLILGGGINGAVAAAALAAKGVKAALIDRKDFASGSSSNSSNLVWGGIKYMETGELLLVNKLCRSRNHLMRHYPSSVREIRFFTTVRKGFRIPAFLMYLGAVAYWLIGACRTRPPRYLRTSTIRREEPVVAVDDGTAGLEYSDAYLPDNDARFVFRFVRSAMVSGCAAANYVEAVDSEFGGGRWRTEVRDRRSGRRFTIGSKALVNACGPYADSYNSGIGQDTTHHHLFSKGVHLIVDRITPHERVLAFFASDGRLFFVIPMGPRTCIGTTDSPVQSPSVQVTDADRQFVLNNANGLLNLSVPLTAEDIIAERCGVRPLAVARVAANETTDWLKLSRRHAINTDSATKFISVFGGKLTDCVNVGEEIVARVRNLGIAVPEPKRVWYGEPSAAQKADFMARAQALYIDGKPTLSGEPLSERIWRRYGTLAHDLLDEIAADPERALYKPVQGIEYTRCELALMARTEMITTLEDFLRRRSKVAQVVRLEDIQGPGLRELCTILFGDDGPQRLREYMDGEAVSGQTLQST